MSEYWKSTPKYWCKFCKQYVRDTKFDKQQHEATPRHQGSIQRSLRTLHRDHEREERNTQRAKDEVARLNGIVSGNSGPAASSSSSSGPKNGLKSTTQVTAPPAQATLQDRKKQIAQLAEMGVAIPQEYRAEIALAGDWETVETRADEQKDAKPEVKNIGVRKRKLEGAEAEDEESGENISRKGWGSTVKTYPGKYEDSRDIEALLTTGKQHPRRQTIVKKEEEEEDHAALDGLDKRAQALPEVPVKKEEPAEDAPVVFKKRKSKATKIG